MMQFLVSCMLLIVRSQGLICIVLAVTLVMGSNRVWNYMTTEGGLYGRMMLPSGDLAKLV